MNSLLLLCQSDGRHLQGGEAFVHRFLVYLLLKFGKDLLKIINLNKNTPFRKGVSLPKNAHGCEVFVFEPYFLKKK